MAFAGRVAGQRVRGMQCVLCAWTLKFALVASTRTCTSTYTDQWSLGIEALFSSSKVEVHIKIQFMAGNGCSGYSPSLVGGSAKAPQVPYLICSCSWRSLPVV
jgi:hypothetical protein